MNERDPIAGGAPLDDDAVASLIQGAGRREPIPPEDLDAIAGAARAAWRARVGEASPAPPQTPRAPRLEARRRAPAALPLALAAAIGAIVAGVGWWVARDRVGPMVPPAQVATLEAATGSLQMDLNGVIRALRVGDAIPSGAYVRTVAASTPGAKPARGALRLETGTLIRMDAGTEVAFESATRLDLVAGAIYADTDPAPSDDEPTRGGDAGIVGGAGAALEVDTLAGTLRDIGTRFSARLIEDSDQPGALDAAAHPDLRVLVRDGRVAVDRETDSVVADAGEQLHMHGDGTVDRRPVRTYGPDWEWVLDAAPRFDVAGKSIAEILDWVSRETGWTVRYQDPALADAARTMVQQASRPEAGALRADQAALVLLPGANLEGVLDAGVLTVKRR